MPRCARHNASDIMNTLNAVTCHCRLSTTGASGERTSTHATYSLSVMMFFVSTQSKCVRYTNVSRMVLYWLSVSVCGGMNSRTISPLSVSTMSTSSGLTMCVIITSRTCVTTRVTSQCIVALSPRDTGARSYLVVGCSRRERAASRSPPARLARTTIRHTPAVDTAPEQHTFERTGA